MMVTSGGQNRRRRTGRTSTLKLHWRCRNYSRRYQVTAWLPSAMACRKAAHKTVPAGMTVGGVSDDGRVQAGQDG
jgi:hypothetical protein